MKEQWKEIDDYDGYSVSNTGKIKSFRRKSHKENGLILKQETKVFCKDFLTDEKNGDFDTVGILYCIRPDGERVDIFKFFKESDDGFVEITEKEYRERELMDKKRRGVDE